MKKQIVVTVILMLLSAYVGWYLAGKTWSHNSPQLNDEILAVINDEIISRDDFLEQMKLRGGQYAGQYHSVEQRKVLLDFLVNQQLMLAAAKSLGVDQEAIVQKVYRQAVIDKYLDQALNQKLAEIKVSSKEIEAYFEANRNSYNRPARRRAAIIYKKLPTDISVNDKADLIANMGSIKQQALEAEEHITHFGQLALQHSDDPNSKYQGGVIGWLIESPQRAYKWPQEVVKTLFELPENGDVSDVIETDKGLYLVRLVNAENVASTELSQMASGIRKKLLNEKQKSAKQAFVDSLQTNAKININSELLAAIEPLNPEPKDNQQQPPAMPRQAGVQ